MDIKQEIDNSVANLLVKVIKEPLTYFSEADIQQILVEELRKIKVLAKTYPTSVNRGKGSKSVYNTSLIHREYGAGDKSRIDVVIFDMIDTKEINNINLVNGKDYLKPLFAFELGTEKSPDTKKHFQNDFEKLKRCKDTGYLIHIYKDVTQARSGTSSRIKTEEKIKTNFKDVFGNISNKNIKVLAVLLRVYRQQSRIIGKCEIYCQGNWKKININDNSKIRSAIMAELSDISENTS